MAAHADFTHEWTEISHDDWDAIAHPIDARKEPTIHPMYWNEVGDDPWSVLSTPREGSPDERDWYVHIGGHRFGRCAPKSMTYSEVCATLKGHLMTLE